MKKVISIVLTVIMLLSTGVFLIPTSADTPAAAPTKVLSVYVADSGSDSNDGLTPATPKKNFKTAFAVMKNKMADDPTYTEGAFVLVGDYTMVSADNPQFEATADSGWKFPMTIKSIDGQKYALVINHRFRIGGETLFTNIKILAGTETTSTSLRADAHKLTIGKPGVENDVITYDPSDSRCKAPLMIFAGSAAGQVNNVKIEHETIDVTLNCGTYSEFHTGTGQYDQLVTGDVNITINNATFTNGVITIGSWFNTKGKYINTDDCIYKGAYNLTINGGKFTNTDIVIGLGGGQQTNTLNVMNARNCVFEGKVTVDINGGTFSSDCHIGKGENIVNPDNYPTITNFEMLHPTTQAEQRGKAEYKGGVEINYAGLNNADKAAFAALIPTADAQYGVAHDSIYVSKSDTQHAITCPCGCGKNEMENHTFGDPETTTQPSHTKEGVKTYTCTLCKGTRTEKIAPDATTHNYTTGWVKNDADTHKKTCDDAACPDSSKGLVTEAHTWDNGEITTEPTHTAEGVKTFKCTVCGETKTETVAKSDIHEYAKKWEPHDDEQHKRSCACGEAKYGNHNFDDGAVTKEATSEAEGVKTFTCKSCGATKTEAIAKLAAAEEPEKSGCGSAIGTVAFVIPMLVGVAFVPVCKKKDR